MNNNYIEEIIQSEIPKIKKIIEDNNNNYHYK